MVIYERFVMVAVVSVVVTSIGVKQKTTSGLSVVLLGLQPKSVSVADKSIYMYLFIIVYLRKL